MGEINDRGTMKWTSIMMPEHIEMLQEVWEAENDVEKPILSEDQLKELERTIQEAMENQLEVDIQYYENNRIKVIDGIIKNFVMGRFEIETPDGVDYLSPDEILDVSVV